MHRNTPDPIFVSPKPETDTTRRTKTRLWFLRFQYWFSCPISEKCPTQYLTIFYVDK